MVYKVLVFFFYCEYIAVVVLGTMSLIGHCEGKVGQPTIRIAQRSGHLP